MTPDTYLILGDFNFQRYEVPEVIQFGGEQVLAVQELVGGKRVIDAMGRRDAELRWRGQFIGSDASDRARYLDFLRADGRPLNLSFGERAYEVVIRSAVMDYRRAYQIPYEICLAVVRDLTIPLKEAPEPAMDETIADDMQTATGLAAQINDGPLSAAMNGLNDAIAAVGSVVTATQSAINTVLVPLSAVQQRVGQLITASGGALESITTLGGILPDNGIAKASARLSSQILLTTQAPLLFDMQSAVGRIGSNISSVSTAGRQVTTAGDNLFAVASREYDDPAAWTGIARANNLADPQLTGVQTLIIPPNPDDAGGVLAA